MPRECKSCEFCVKIPPEKAPWVYQPAPAKPRPLAACRIKGYVFYADKTSNLGCSIRPKSKRDYQLLAYFRPDLVQINLTPQERHDISLIAHHYEGSFENVGEIEIEV